MKITVLCKYFSPRGGAQGFLLAFVRELLADGHRVKVVTMEARGTLEGVEVQTLRLRPVFRTFRDLLFARASRRVLEQERADLTFAEQKVWGADVIRAGGGVQGAYLRQIVKSYPPGLLGRGRSLARRISLKERLSLHVERRLFNQFTPRAIIANSDMVRRELLDWYPHLSDRVEVVYNGADCERFTPELRRHRQQVRASLDIAESALVGAFVSKDLQRKGLPTVMRALSLLKQDGSRLPAYAIVVGPRKAWAARLARKLEVSDRVRFVGVEAPDRYYGASDLAVLPSYYDACANVTVEGLACGLPVLTTVHNGGYEMLAPGLHGFYLEDASDARQLAEHMQYYMDPDNMARSRDAARELALRYTFRGQYERIMEVIARVAREKAGEAAKVE